MAKLGDKIELGAGFTAEVTAVSEDGRILSYKLHHPQEMGDK